mgnify:FL=1
MIIRKMTASFGRLEDSTLTLSPGLNLICAPNEAGKSTWCTFIQTMFYGLPASERAREGFLPVKKRFVPWSGAPMGGSMELLLGDGRAITLERRSSGRQPMRDFAAFVTGTSIPVPELTSETVGESLLGVPRAVFERSAFIGQNCIRVDHSDELERRIAALVTTGDESSSYKAADAALRAWQRKRNYKGRGIIPQLEREIASIDETLRRIEECLERAAALKEQGEALTGEIDALEQELSECEQFERESALRRAKSALEKATEKAEKLRAQLESIGNLPAEEDISSIFADLKALETVKMMEDAERARLDEAASALNDARAALEKYRAEDIERDTPRAEKLMKILSLTKLKSALTGSLGAVLVLGGLVAAFLEGPARIAGCIAAILAAAALIVRAAVSVKTRKELDDILARHNVPGVEAFAALKAEISAAKARVQEAEQTVSARKNSYESAVTAVNSHRDRLAEAFRRFGLGDTPEEALRTLAAIKRLQTEIEAAEAEKAAAEKLYAAEAEALPHATLRPAPEPARPRNLVQTDLRAARLRQKMLAEQENIARGEAQALGDPVVLGTRRLGCIEALAEAKRDFNALQLAIETLAEVNHELETRFSPLIGSLAGEILSKITGGRYEKLVLDRTFSARAKAAGASTSREIPWLSAGTVDQVYLALRLAVCRLVLPQEDPAPLILDDALANFDDTRMGYALDYLLELSKERQILLFTCHAREAEYLSGRPGVSLVSLS